MAAPGVKRAVVVGIDRYPDPAITDLEGAVADARAMASLLVDHFDFAPGGVSLLLDADATADAIDRALDEMASTVAPGGVAVFFFAGHGARRFDDSGDEADGWDETLVPCDSGRDGRPDRDLTDDRLRVLLDRLCARAGAVSVILDCCHAGTAGRAAAGVRAAPPGIGPRAPRAGLRAKAGEPPYALVAAAAADERAHERPPRPGERPRGLLSHALGEALRSLGPRDTWRTVMARVEAAVLAREPAQRPRVEGAGRDRRPFSTAAGPAAWADALAAPDGVRVALGRLHGVAVGDRIGLVAQGDGPLHLAPVLEVGPVSCRTAPRPGLVGPLRALPPRPASPWTVALDDPQLAVHFDLDALIDDDGRAVARPGEVVTARVINPGGRRLYPTIVRIDAADRVTVLWPEPGTAEALAPFAQHAEPLEAALPGGADEAHERLLLVVTDLPVDLRPLEGPGRGAIPAPADVACATRRAELWIRRDP